MIKIAIILKYNPLVLANKIKLSAFSLVEISCRICLDHFAAIALICSSWRQPMQSLMWYIFCKVDYLLAVAMTFYLKRKYGRFGKKKSKDFDKYFRYCILFSPSIPNFQILFLFLIATSLKWTSWEPISQHTSSFMFTLMGN